MGYLYLFALALIIAFVSTPVLTWFAKKNGIVDKPGKHKTHIEAVPLLGGVGIFLSISITLLFFFSNNLQILSLLAAGLLLMVVGIIDDLYNIKPLHKLACQGAIATAVVVYSAYMCPILSGHFERYRLPMLAIMGISILWIVLMTNAYNLIDGIDGLATGTAVIIFAAMAAVAYIQGHTMLLVVNLIGMAACLGFLPYNFNPAKIFMGDAGSMVLGYILAISHIYLVVDAFSLQVALGSAFIFAYPFLDVSFAIYRRLRHRSSIFRADRGHIHHVLMNMGFSVRKTVLIIYLFNLFFGGMAVMAFCLSLSPVTVVMLGVVTMGAFYILFRYLYKQLYHRPMPGVKPDVLQKV